ncbi:MAG: hypothetical protein KDJ82_15855 [Rhodobacteraceae bacterium]|nr:hypothetical protein [Paracoccaceae bacterium]
MHFANNQDEPSLFCAFYPQAVGAGPNPAGCEIGRASMICVLVWHNAKSGAAAMRSSSLGISARVRNPQHGKALPVLPGNFAMTKGEFALSRTVQQARHISTLVQLAERALGSGAAAQPAAAPLRLVQNGKP